MGAFKRKGLRFPGQSPLFRELENRNKVVRPRASRIPSLSASELKTLRGKRHHDVTDDRHLIEAALAERAFIITRDPWLLEKRALFKTKLDIEVYPPEEVQAE